MPVRALAWMLALMLAFMLSLTVFAAAADLAVTSEWLHTRASMNDSVVSEQMERIQGRIRELAQDYSFDAEAVAALISRDSIRDMDQEYARWWTRIVREGTIAETPEWSFGELQNRIEETMDPAAAGDEETAHELAGEAASALEKTVHETLMPVRRALITLGVNWLRKRIDFPSASRLLGQIPFACAAVCLLISGLIMLAVSRHPRFGLKAFGTAAAGAGITVLAGMVTVMAVDLPQMLQQSSAVLAHQAGILLRPVLAACLVCAALMTAGGYICLYRYRKGQAPAAERTA